MVESLLTVTESSGVHVVRFQESSILDALTVDRVAADLQAVVAVKEPRRIVLSLDGVTFLSSRALGVFVALRKKAEESKSTVVFAGVRPELTKVFALTKLDKLFRCLPTVDAAVDALRPQA